MSYLLRYTPNSYGLYLTSSKTADADAAKFAMIGYENTIGLINQSNTIFEILKPNMTDAKSDEMEYFLTNLNTIIDSKSDNPQEFSRIVSAIENDLNESNNIRMQSTTSTVDPSLRVYCDNIDILLNNVIPYIQNGDYLAADKKYILYILDNYEYLKTQIEEVNSTLMLQIYRNKYERKFACNQKSNLTSCCH
jgi:high-affinity iron transporter